MYTHTEYIICAEFYAFLKVIKDFLSLMLAISNF